MSKVVTWLLSDEESGDIRIPVTDLSRIFVSIGAESDISSANRIAQGGVIKRAYVPHDITPLLAVAPEAPEPTASGDKYYNSTERKLHTAYLTDGELSWNAGSTPTEDRIFVDMSANRLYHWHGGDMHEVGAASSGGGGIEVEFV